MSTKYILHGGRKPGSDYTKDFFEEIIHDLPEKKLMFLYVPFAKEKEQWEKAFAEKKEEFSQAYPNKQITFLLADENPEKFLDQTHTADIIFLAGGNTQNILKLLKTIPLSVLTEHLTNKTIVGTSAGANVLSKYYYSNHRQQVEEGLGILPIKIFCHYTLEHEPQLEELEIYKEHLTSFALPEDYFVIIQ